MPDGNHLWRTNDHAQTRRAIARHSRVDAEAYDEYGRAMVDMGRFVRPILGLTPADPMSLNPRGLKQLLFLLRRFQQLSRQDQYNQIQLMTMSAADFLDQWFETDVLKATMAASGIIGTFLGIRSPGTAYVLLHHYMGEIDGAFRSWGLARGGTGAISNAIAAAARAGRRRDSDGDSRSRRSWSRENTADGRRARKRRRDRRRTSSRRASIPRLTFLRLLDPSTLPDEFVADVRRYKFRGSSGKVNLALDALPDFTMSARAGTRTFAAPSRSRRAWNTWSAPTTMRSTAASPAGPTSTSSSRRSPIRAWRRRAST